MADTLQTLSIISFAVAGVCLVLTLFFLFFFKIPTVIGDLSGRTAKKSIAKMRAANEKSGVKSFKGSKTNAERGKLTGTIPDSNKLEKKNERTEDERPETGLLSDNQADKLEYEATGILADNKTDILDMEATGLLVDEEQTSLLDGISVNQTGRRADGKKLTVLEEIILVHTDEVIE